MNMVLAAAVTFVGTHFLLSHPLRAPIVGRIGERGFLVLYSVVAFATLIWIISAYRAALPTPPLWPAGDVIWAVASVVMLAASVLLMGSLIRNPAMPEAKTDTIPEARGVFAITRHPMMWAFALWGAAHILVYPELSNIIVASAIILLALIGAAMQDRKKEALQPEFWRGWEARTSYWPFAAIAAGRARFGGFGMHTLAGGLVVWLVATWAHIPLSGWRAGIWYWLN